MISQLRRLFKTPLLFHRGMRDVLRRLEIIQYALGQVQSRLAELEPASTPLSKREFQAFSQWGEDGIINFLLGQVKGLDPSFIEFGVENYTESNTRFLLCNRYWRGLIMDGDPAAIEFIENDNICWRQPLRAACHFVTRENINELFRKYGFEGPLGLLSIDMDGMDYWIWEAIHSVQPGVVVMEYNGLFGADARVVVPYRPDFQRHKAHSSGLYFGASLAALHALGEEKGYSLVGVNRAGNNAFFVEEAKRGTLPRVSPSEAYTPPKFREARDSSGRLLFLHLRESFRLIEELPVCDLAANRERPLMECVHDLDRFGKF